MNIEKQIQEYLRSEGEKLPWPFGWSGNLSAKAQRVWCMLPLWRQLLVSKFNPYKYHRMNGLLDLNREGISYIVLREISGLSGRTIDATLCRMKREKDHTKF